MTEKELRKLSRMDLLELLIQQSKLVEELRGQLREAEAALESRRLAVDKAGSIAEAALKVNGVFEAAQAAGQQYLNNIKELSLRQETICQQMEDDCRLRCQKLLAETEARCEEMERRTEWECAAARDTAKAESKSYWDEVSHRLEAFYAEHNGLRELLSTLS